MEPFISRETSEGKVFFDDQGVQCLLKKEKRGCSLFVRHGLKWINIGWISGTTTRNVKSIYYQIRGL